ncbi:MAG: AAA family ATPase, partial [Pyrodictiaceae archaeon]
PDVGKLREPQQLRETDRLDPRASNLAAVLYAIMGRRGRLPESIEHALSRLFPGTRLKLETLYGRVALYAEEDGVELPPPNMPDGLFKLLSILVAVELGPSLLLIDEVENSLHLSALEYVVDTLDSLEVPVIVATHSPVVVDLAGPEKTLVTARDPDKGTVVEEFKSPRELLKKLGELGIAFSDYVLHRTSAHTEAEP